MTNKEKIGQLKKFRDVLSFLETIIILPEPKRSEELLNLLEEYFGPRCLYFTYNDATKISKLIPKEVYNRWVKKKLEEFANTKHYNPNDWIFDN